MARSLASSHQKIDPKLRRVEFYPDPKGEEVRLLEVVAGSLEAGEVYPFRFAPDLSRNLPYATVLIELSPSEFERLGKGPLQLPPDWKSPLLLFSSDGQ